MHSTSLKAAAIVVAAVFSGSAQAETLIVAHGFQPSHVIYKNGIEAWMACVSDRAKGAIEFQHFPGGQISGHKDSITSLNNGVAHISGVVPGYESSRLPLTNLSALPGMGTTAVQTNAAFRAMLENGSPILDEWTASGLVPLLSMITPGYQIMSTTGRLDTMAKLKGLKLRSGAGAQSAAVTAVGGVPVEITAGDMYLALQRGTVDGTVLSLTSAPAYKLDELIKSVSLNGNFATGQTVWTIEKATFDKLAPDVQATMVACGKELEIANGVDQDKKNKEIADLYASRGVDMYEFPPEMLKQIDAALAPVAEDFVRELEARGLPARKTYEMYRAVLTNLAM